jgi:hypothetical protein
MRYSARFKINLYIADAGLLLGAYLYIWGDIRYLSATTNHGYRRGI